MIGQPSNRFVQQKKEKDLVFLLFLYPDPGSNRDGLPHWCLRPARLPIPPSGHTLYRDCGCKDRENFLLRKKFSLIFSFYFSRLTPPTLRVGASAPLRRNLLRKKFSLLFSFYFSRLTPPTRSVGASAPLRRNLPRKKFSLLFSFYFSRLTPARQPQAARHCLIPPEGACAARQSLFNPP